MKLIPIPLMYASSACKFKMVIRFRNFELYFSINSKI